MRTEIRIDTIRLRTHIDYKNQELRYVHQLEEHLRLVLAHSDANVHSVIVSMIQQTEAISRHCVSMSEKLDRICSEFERTGKHISEILNDYVAQNKSD